MTPPATFATPDAVVYPDSDGKPMAENTLQYEWIVMIRENVARLFQDRDDVFVAADNLIYPVRGDATVCTAPDVYVAFGRPHGHRGSYKVWEEGGTFPQVVFEVWSPGNTRQEMTNKRGFYRRHGAEEYYLIDPDTNEVEAWVRDGRRLVEVEDVSAFVSPRLGIRFVRTGDELRLVGPTGERFLTFAELGDLLDTAQEKVREEQKRADEEKRRADREKKRADEQKQRAEQEKQRADQLAAKLRELGLDPDAV